MIEVVFGLVLLVLAGAVVLLFAMVGELASRVGIGDRGRAVRPLDGARLGHTPVEWPADLAPVAAADRALVLVLSTACGSCRDVATQLAGELVRPLGTETAVVVSCATRASGTAFVDEHGLGSLTHLIDEGGTWVKAELGVGSSPAGLVVRAGRLESALEFVDLKALRRAVMGAETSTVMEVAHA